jgi:serine/threonine-protein kinase PRP4
MASDPSSKRQRLDSSKDTDQESKEDGEEDLLNLMNGDDFVTEDQRRESEAQTRRQQRKERLQRAQEDEAAKLDSKEDQTVAKTQYSGTTELAEQLVQGDSTESVPIATGNIEPEKNEDDDDRFNMFSDSVSPMQKASGKTAASDPTKRGHGQGDWDDAEGYYKAVNGEVISLDSSASDEASASFRVLGVVGKGVFSTVLKCSTVSNSSSVKIPPMVAIKSIRHNEIMAKAAENEIRFLQRLKGSAGIVQMFLPTTATPLEHRGHIMLVFSFMEYNLRDVLQKFGKGVGLSLTAVRSYYAQLLSAATHLQKHNLIHADLKPDNILVSADFGVVQLADFGSAIDVNSPGENQPTPYLISRFYRAPEVILGLVPTFAADLWSISVTIAEIFLGRVLFRGTSNNDMLYSFMQYLGPFSNRIIRQHLVQCQRLPIPRHFQQEGANYMFTKQAADAVTGQAVHKILSLLPRNNENKFPLSTPLSQQLLKAKSGKDSRTLVNRFSDLLQKCLALDPTRRIALRDALQHDFFRSADETKAT